MSPNLNRRRQEVLLVNALILKISEALRIAANILDSGVNIKNYFRKLWRPDHYFGLDALKQYFPNVQIIDAPKQYSIIPGYQALKVKYWGTTKWCKCTLAKLLRLKAYTAKTLKLENESIEIKR